MNGIDVLPQLCPVLRVIDGQNVLPGVMGDPHLHGLFLTVTVGQLVQENPLRKMVVLYLDAWQWEWKVLGVSLFCIRVALMSANSIRLGQEKIFEKAVLNFTSVMLYSGHMLSFQQNFTKTVQSIINFFTVNFKKT